VMALLISASPTRPSTTTLVSLLTAQPAVDVNAALARLDAGRGGGVGVAARAAQP